MHPWHQSGSLLVVQSTSLHAAEALQKVQGERCLAQVGACVREQARALQHHPELITLLVDEEAVAVPIFAQNFEMDLRALLK
jgi:hypothetical protein